MSDPYAQPATPTLADRILQTPDKLWRKIKTAVNAPTREAAAQLATQDQTVASRIESILGDAETVLTKKRPQQASMLGRQPAAKPSAADTLYGKGLMI